MKVELIGPTYYDVEKSEELEMIRRGSLEGERGQSGSSGAAGSSYETNYQMPKTQL